MRLLSILMMIKPTERFTETVQDYVKYRPSYPKAILDKLIDVCGLSKDSVIADVGSGTGLLAQLFLANGNTVYGVEPNQAMRAAGEIYLQAYPQFHSIAACAEATGLASNSINLITVGTAFHWFDAEKTKIEFQRIAKPKAWVLLVWNVRNTKKSALVSDYEEVLVKYAKDYCASGALKINKALASFFKPYFMRTASFENVQQFDWQGFKGRLLSTSYSLRVGDLAYEAMLSDLKTIFDRYQKKGRVTFLYETKLYYSPI